MNMDDLALEGLMGHPRYIVIAADEVDEITWAIRLINEVTGLEGTPNLNFRHQPVAGQYGIIAFVNDNNKAHYYGMMAAYKDIIPYSRCIVVHNGDITLPARS